MKGENEEINNVTPKARQNGESGTFSRAKERHVGKKIVLTEQNSTGTVPRTRYIEIHPESIAGQRAPERTPVRICAIFEIAMMSPPSGFSPFEEGLLR